MCGYGLKHYFMADNTNERAQNDEKRTDNDNYFEKLKGSRTDPQKTEMEGLKRGGVEPNVHPQDKPKDEKGRVEE